MDFCDLGKMATRLNDALVVPDVLEATVRFSIAKCLQ